MVCDVNVGDETVDIRFSGVDRVLALSSGITLRFDEITGARVAPRDDVKEGLGWRVGGGYWPGSLATGHFTLPGAKGERQLWSVYRDTEVLVIDTTRQRPRRVVLQHPDRERLAWWINERIAS